MGDGRVRLGIFGGSFDPVHIGHLWIAESAQESLGLDEVRWLPAAMSPLKPGGTRASAEDRLEMLRLALAGVDKHVVDDREIRRGGVSYTVDTMAEIREENPTAAIFLIIGGDSLASFGQWHQPTRLLGLIQLAVVHRGGEPPIDFAVLKGLADDSQIEQARRHVIQMPIIQVSSSELRQRIAAGRSIRFRTPDPVRAWIEAKRIYQSKA